MEVKQVYELVNNVTREVLGEDVQVAEDLSNVVDVGTAIFNANSFDHYAKTLVDHIGRMVFVNRVYKGFAPNIKRDAWEFGAALQKVSADMPEAVENEDWELENGASYDPFIFNGAHPVQKFFNKRVTFEIDRSITEDQLKSAFSSGTQLNAFVSMIFNEIDKSLTVKTDGLIMSGINSMIGDTLYDDFNSGSSFSGGSHVKAVNLLYLYNADKAEGSTITAAQAVKDPEFLRFAALTMKNYVDRLKAISTLFNIDKQARFTPTDLLHVVVLSEFDNAMQNYLYNGTGIFKNENLVLPKHETVPFWQKSGTGYAFDDTSSINVTTGNGNDVTATGILAVMFDSDAVMVTNEKDEVRTQYNAKAGFTNYFYKRFEGLLADSAENFVVFFVA